MFNFHLIAPTITNRTVCSFVEIFVYRKKINILLFLHESAVFEKKTIIFVLYLPCFITSSFSAVRNVVPRFIKHIYLVTETTIAVFIARVFKKKKKKRIPPRTKTVLLVFTCITLVYTQYLHSANHSRIFLSPLTAGNRRETTFVYVIVNDVSPFSINSNTTNGV